MAQQTSGGSRAVADSSPSGTGTTLARGAIGLPEVLFQSITFMAPAAAVAVSIAVGATFAGGALPLAVLVGLVASLLVANSMGQLARHLPSAGGVYIYPAEGLHESVGFLVAWGYALVTSLVGPLTNLLFGYLCASTLQGESWWPFGFKPTWIGFLVAVALLIALLNYYGVKIGARAGVILGSFEIVVFVLLAVWLIVGAGHANTLSVFTLKWAHVKGFNGFSGVAAGTVYVMLAFIGFEAAAPLAEETRNPRRLIPIAVIASCLLIGLLFVYTTYAAAVFVGPAHFATYGGLGGGSPWVAFGRHFWGLGWIVVFLAVANSAFANGNSAAIAVTRTWYALARVRLLPSAFGRTHPTRRSPSFGVVFQLVFTLVVGISAGLKYGPVNGFVLLATMLTAVMIAIYIVINLSCIGFFLRRARSEFNPVLHLAIPVLGIVAFVPVLLTALGIGKSLLRFVAPLPYPVNLAGPFLGVWYLFGILYLAYLYARAPQKLGGLREVFAE